MKQTNLACLRFLRTGFAVAILLLTSQGNVFADVFSGPGFTILDGAGRLPGSCSTVPVAGLTTDTIVRSVTLVNANHSFLGDLEVRLYPPGAAPPPSSAAPSGVLSSPPDGRACNLSGTYSFVDIATQSIDAATAGCNTATNLAPGDYRTSTYGGGTNPGPVTSLTTTFGVRTPAQANGNWLVCVFDFASPNGGTIGGVQLQLVSPTSAPVVIAGRVTTSDGRGIPNTMVTLLAPSGETMTAITSPFGYYRFDGAAGTTYLVSAVHKRYEFENSSITHHALEDAEGLNFVALP